MSSGWSRRAFLGSIGAAAAASARSVRALAQSRGAFDVSILSDEISQDVGHALEVASGEFGLGFVELRELWGKNIMRLDDQELGEAERLIGRFRFRVSAIASPVFKVDWPGAPISTFSPNRDQFKADYTFADQAGLLERACELARRFGTGRVRIFDCWRLDDQAPYRAAIDDMLRQAAEKAGRRKVTLVLENEYACNTATSAEAARVLDAVRSPAFALAWDPGNAGRSGDAAFPEGYRRLPKGRIGHVHCKNVARKADGTYEWAEMGGGLIDWVGQFRALKADGYRGSVTLETHWRGAGTPEASSRASWASMKRQLREAGAL
jgi:L-ribulose-5-phosphate 3-epimerase